MISERWQKSSLRILQALFYLAFVSLWFKDSFPALRAIPLSPSWAFIPLVVVTLLRWLLRTRSARNARPSGWGREAAVLAMIVVLAALVRVPFLAHGFGLMDSDEAIPALMGKHIAQGQRPPLFFYGALFQGSFPQHYMAAFFKLFGYSIFLAKFSAVLAFLLFLVVQFFLIKKAFSFGFACVAGLFYVLPWHELLRASLDLGSGFPIVFLLGSLVFTLTADIVFDDQSKRLGTLGFILGLAFWSHQISFIFCLAVAPFLAYKFRARIKNYLELAVYFFIGCFPLVLNELARGFPIIRVFFLDQSGSVDAAKFIRARRSLLALFSSGPPTASRVYLGVIAVGFLTVILLAVRRRTPPASLIFPVYFTAFMGVYILSRFGSVDVIRYLYILYIAVPVFLCAPFLWFRPKVGFPAAAAFVALVFGLSQAGASRAYYRDVQANHEALLRAVTAMTKTGEKYWISDFWTSYLLTSVSGERLIVASKDVRRYYPYELRYWNGGRNNWVIAKNRGETELYASVIPQVADRVGVTYEKKDVGEFTLIYRLSQDIFPRVILADPPEKLPEVRLSRISSGKGALSLEFIREDSRPTPGLSMRVEIPGYCARFFPIWERGSFTARIPFPLEPEVKIDYGFAYARLKLAGFQGEARWTAGVAELAQPRPAFDFLEGIGPEKDVEGRPMFVCQKDARIEVNEPLDKGTILALDLYSPFDFQEPWWYGDFIQSVSIFVNGRVCGERALSYRHNRIRLRVEPPLFRGHGDVVRLKFKYAMPLLFDDNWKTAAFLERVTFE